jgi:hypothetical protein
LPDFSWYSIPKRGKIYPIITKLHKWPCNIPNDSKIFQKAITYTIIFYSKALQNLPKLEFLVWKQTIWQPCFCSERLEREFFGERSHGRTNGQVSRQTEGETEERTDRLTLRLQRGGWGECSTLAPLSSGENVRARAASSEEKLGRLAEETRGHPSLANALAFPEKPDRESESENVPITFLFKRRGNNAAN